MYDELVKRLKTECTLPFQTLQLLRDAADAIEELSHDYEKLAEDFNGAVELLHKRSKPRWIPVTERLPEIKEPVLAMVHWDDYGDTMMCYGCRYKTRWYLWNCVEGELLKDFTVTHWMPLPSTEGLDEA